MMYLFALLCMVFNEDGWIMMLLSWFITLLIGLGLWKFVELLVFVARHLHLTANSLVWQ